MLKIKEYANSESFKKLLDKIVLVHKRFPLSILSSFALSFFLICLGELDSETEVLYIKLTITLAIALPLLLSIELLNERDNRFKWPLIFFGIIILLAYFFTNSPYQEIHEKGPYIHRSFILILIAHLLVAISPFLYPHNKSSFWQYNKTVLISILTAFLYSLTLFIGLSLALLAVDKLFEIGLLEKYYLYLFILIILYFNTCFFLSNLPKLQSIENQSAYPKGLKVFTQYILLPIVGVYLIILLSYEIKIIINWNLPIGWVSILVISSGILGILAFLLLEPVKNSTKWIRKFNQGFYWTLIPLLALMFVAIYVRIDQYGITEARYYVAILATWLTGISCYFIISKKEDIKWIPSSLILLGMVSIYGPLSSFNVSKQNQSKRLNEVLEKYNMMENDKWIRDSGTGLSDENKAPILSTLVYLSARHPESLESYLEPSNFKSFKRENGNLNLDSLTSYLGISEVKQQTNLSEIISKAPFNSLTKSYQADYFIRLEGFRGFENLINSEGDDLNYNLKYNSENSIELELSDEKLIFHLDDILFNKNEKNILVTSESLTWKATLEITLVEDFRDGPNLFGHIFLFKK